LFEAELLGPGAQCLLVARRGAYFPIDIAPVARVVTVLLAKLAQTEPLARPQFFDESSKHTVVGLW